MIPIRGQKSSDDVSEGMHGSSFEKLAFMVPILHELHTIYFYLVELLYKYNI
jgi:hypothetical protein